MKYCAYGGQLLLRTSMRIPAKNQPRVHDLQPGNKTAIDNIITPIEVAHLQQP